MAPSRVLLVVVLANLVAAHALNAQQNDVIPTSQNQPLINGILAEDRTAIEAAANTHDPALIPVIKRALANIDGLGVAAASHHDQTRNLLRRALLKLDDRVEQQAFWCMTTADMLAFPASGFQDFGWYGIQALDAVLSGVGNARFLRAVHHERPTDVSFASPTYYAIQALKAMLPDGPPIGDRRVWRAWIAAHADELKSLRPSGAGIDFTEAACKNGEPRVAPTSERTPANERIMEGILAGDVDSIRQAADSENVLFVPYLKTALLKGVSARTTRSERENIRKELHYALVELDDAATQQQFWCWIMRSDPDFRVETLDDVGGWFSLQALDAVLAGAGHKQFSRDAKWRDYGRDTTWESPAEHALRVLPRIVSIGPYGPFAETNITTDAMRAWRNWMHEHEERLHTLTPIGGGVVFSERACKVLKVERGW